MKKPGGGMPSGCIRVTDGALVVVRMVSGRTNCADHANREDYASHVGL